MVIKAILFDFDGLILDTETPIFSAWQQIYAEFACSLTAAEYSTCVGSTHTHFDPFRDLEKKHGKPMVEEEIRPRVSKIYKELILQKEVLPGIREALAAARDLGIKTALASNSDRAWVEGHLGRLELLPFFQIIRTRDDVARLKPAPDLFLSVLEGLGVAPEEAIVLEDSPHGILAARRAGVFCVAIPNEMTCAMHLNDPDLCLTSLAEMPFASLLDRIQEEKLSRR